MTLPATIELCARIRDGYPCLGRVHRSGVPEIVSCMACGSRATGVVYTLSPVAEYIRGVVDAAKLLDDADQGDALTIVRALLPKE